MRQKGFTLVELVIVFSVIALLSIVGIASFVSFTQRQVLGNAVSDLRTTLNVARMYTLSQYNDSCTNSQQLGGYVVVVCCNPSNNQTPMSNCPAIGCSGSYDYELYESCVHTDGSITYNVVKGQQKNFPKAITVSSQTSARTFQFTPISGKVTFGGALLLAGQSGNVVLSTSITQGTKQTGVSQTVSVSPVGTIQ